MTDLYRRLRLADTLTPEECGDLADLLERTANALNRRAALECRYVNETADPITVIRAWLYRLHEAGTQAADPTDRDVIREAQHEEGRRIAEAVTTAGRLRDEFDFAAAHQEVHVAIAEEIDRNRARADAELENGVVLALADWLAHRNELKGRDSIG